MGRDEKATDQRYLKHICETDLPMSDTPRDPWVMTTLQYVGAVLSVPTLYVLSIGPVAGLTACDVIPSNVALKLNETLYAPLIRVLEASPTICEWLVHYESLFVP